MLLVAGLVVCALTAGEEGPDGVYRDRQGLRWIEAAVNVGQVVLLAFGDVQCGPLSGELPRVGRGILIGSDRDAVVPVPFPQVEATPIDVSGDDEGRCGEPPLRAHPEHLGSLGEFRRTGLDARIRFHCLELLEQLLPRLLSLLRRLLTGT